MANFLQEYNLANLYIIDTLISVDKCLDIAITVVRLITSYYVLYDV